LQQLHGNFSALRKHRERRDNYCETSAERRGRLSFLEFIVWRNGVVQFDAPYSLKLEIKTLQQDAVLASLELIIKLINNFSQPKSLLKPIAPSKPPG
jgi:hypothetical protein